MMGKKRNHSRIDPERSFRLWAETGSIQKTCYRLKEEGFFNPRTGEPYSVQGVWQACGRYVTENMVDARKIFEEVWRANGVIIRDADWYKFVVDKTHYLPAKRRAEFLKNHPFLIPYAD